ncbi:MAG: dihydrofolate reductase [Candidatus Omnitrophica bacterium]|nr:dihydrofolate reductase [Candidatus Omnitrophota bacterium]
MMKSFSIVVAIDQNRGIGKEGALPWHIPEDLGYFKQITSFTVKPDLKNAVIMGRKTWESIPERFRPLKGRVNVVVSRNDQLVLPGGVFRAENVDHALRILDQEQIIADIFVIGGQQIYEQTVKHPRCEKLYITRINKIFDCSVFFPVFEDKFSCFLIAPMRYSVDTPFQFTIYKTWATPSTKLQQ